MSVSFSGPHLFLRTGSELSNLICNPARVRMWRAPYLSPLCISRISVGFPTCRIINQTLFLPLNAHSHTQKALQRSEALPTLARFPFGECGAVGVGSLLFSLDGEKLNEPWVGGGVFGGLFSGARWKLESYRSGKLESCGKVDR